MQDLLTGKCKIWWTKHDIHTSLHTKIIPIGIWPHFCITPAKNFMPTEHPLMSNWGCERHSQVYPRTNSKHPLMQGYILTFAVTKSTKKSAWNMVPIIYTTHSLAEKLITYWIHKIKWIVYVFMNKCRFNYWIYNIVWLQQTHKAKKPWCWPKCQYEYVPNPIRLHILCQNVIATQYT